MNTGSPPTRILVVEDDPGLVRYLRLGLDRAGFTVVTAASGRMALDLLERDPVDLVMLDLGLPDMDGLELITLLRVRRLMLPIIVLSSRAQEKVKVEALELGADDYLTKPFGMAELVARIHAARRNYTSPRERSGQHPERAVYRAGDLTVDLALRQVTVAGAPVHLSPRQYRLLEFLVEHAGKLLTREAILREVWNDNSDVQYLRIYVRALRQKLEPRPDRPIYIMTEIGVGYRMRPAE